MSGRRIAVAGKGGTGKTTIAGTLARMAARAGREVWAIDADSNPNLSLSLGIPRDQPLEPMPRTMLHEHTDAEGNRRVGLAAPGTEIVRRYGIPAPDAVTLLLMGRVGHAGAG
jgi:CO dehydrogenase maturation factor